jgi:hypothetical protein
VGLKTQNLVISSFIIWRSDVDFDHLHGDFDDLHGDWLDFG